MGQDDYLSALRFRALTPAFDWVVRVTTRERAFKQQLLDQVDLGPGQSLLDIGCGTGTFAVLAKVRQPQAAVRGLDGDPEILELAAAKAARAGVSIPFDRGLSTELPFEDRSFDRVVATLFFHHLTRSDKRRTLGEVARVLVPGGELHVADWGPGGDPVMRAASWPVRLFDGLDRTRDNFSGALPGLIEEAGFGPVAREDALRTPLGSLELHRALWPAEAAR